MESGALSAAFFLWGIQPRATWPSGLAKSVDQSTNQPRLRFVTDESRAWVAQGGSVQVGVIGIA